MRGILALLMLLVSSVALAQGPGAVYEGAYFCGQGQSRLVLRLQPRQSNLAPDMVIFEFGPTAANPNQPDGSFFVSGMLTETALNLQPVNWIKQPPGYEMVGLSGASTDQGRSFQGTIVAPLPGCSTFSVTRVR